MVLPVGQEPEEVEEEEEGDMRWMAVITDDKGCRRTYLHRFRSVYQRPSTE